MKKVIGDASATSRRAPSTRRRSATRSRSRPARWPTRPRSPARCGSRSSATRRSRASRKIAVEVKVFMVGGMVEERILGRPEEVVRSPPPPSHTNFCRKRLVNACSREQASKTALLIAGYRAAQVERRTRSSTIPRRGDRGRGRQRADRGPGQRLQQDRRSSGSVRPRSSTRTSPAWTPTKKQVVLLGAGLDTRAARFHARGRLLRGRSSVDPRGQEAPRGRRSPAIRRDAPPTCRAISRKTIS